jgi:hypothetical protein
MPTTVRDYLRFFTEAQAQLGHRGPKDWKYSSMEDYVFFHNGISFTSQSLTEEELEIVHAAVDNAQIRFKPQQCFYNSQVLVTHDLTNTLVYNEGYGIANTPIAVFHGWASINGKVVDLTWRVKKTSRKGRLPDRIFGKIPSGFDYFGVPFDRKTIMSYAAERHWMGFLIDDYKNKFPLLRGESYESK